MAMMTMMRMTRMNLCNKSKKSKAAASSTGHLLRLWLPMPVIIDIIFMTNDDHEGGSDNHGYGIDISFVSANVLHSTMY